MKIPKIKFTAEYKLLDKNKSYYKYIDTFNDFYCDYYYKYSENDLVMYINRVKADKISGILTGISLHFKYKKNV